MPDTLCRNCGTELEEQSKCSECRRPIQQICPKCHYATLEQIHSDCTLGFEIMAACKISTNNEYEDKVMTTTL